MADFREEKVKSEFEERVVSVDRVAYTVAGGRRMRFRALVVVGNRQGKVGMGVAKAGEVAAAIQKAVVAAKKNLIQVPIVRDTIPHMIQVSFGSAHVMLKPAPAGTSVIAGGSVRAVIELAGVKNLRSKILGSNSKINNVTATLLALKQLRTNGLRVSTQPTAEVTPAEPTVTAPVEQASSAVITDTPTETPSAKRTPKKAKENA